MKNITLLVVILMAGCVSVRSVPTPTYVPPKKIISSITNVIDFKESYNAVWQSLIEYSSKSFFSIKSFEKDSGLLTLSFGIDNPSKYVDCGKINAKHLKKKGPYLSVVQTTGSVELSGISNIFVKPMSNRRTRISVNSRYILKIKDGYLPYKIWSFDTSGKQSQTQGIFSITCMSTLVAERSIISGVNSILKSTK